MRSTFFGIEIGKTGINLSQLGLDVTGHNIANVETRGYTRQRIITAAYDPFSNIGQLMPLNLARVGGGVRVMLLDQIRDAHLDRRFRTENTINSYWQTRTTQLRYLESFFDNVNEETSINFSIARLFEAMKILAEDTVEGAPRKLLQTAGLDLVQQLNLTYQGIVDLQATQDMAVRTTVDAINRISEQIAELNKNIYAFEVTGKIANDLRDKRNVLVDDLSKIIDISYRDESDGRGGTFFIVEIGGKELVNHTTYNTLQFRYMDNVIEGEDQVSWPIWAQPRAELNGVAVPVNPAYTGDGRDVAALINKFAREIERRNNDIIKFNDQITDIHDRIGAFLSIIIPGTDIDSFLGIDGKDQLPDLRTVAGALQTAIDGLAAGITARRDFLRNQINNVLRPQITALRDDVRTKNSQITQLERARDRLDPDDPDYAVNYAAANQEVLDAQDELDILQGQLDSALGLRQTYRDELNGVIPDPPAPLPELADLRNRLAEHEALLSQVNNLIETLERRETALERRGRSVEGLVGVIDEPTITSDPPPTDPDPVNPRDPLASIYVSFTDANGVERVLIDENGFNRTTIGFEPGEDLVVTGGELRAYIDMRDNTSVNTPGIPYYIEMLNNLARALVQEINAVHREGWTDTPEGSVNGVNFFLEDPAFWTWTDADGNRLSQNADGAWVDANGILVMYDDGDRVFFIDGRWEDATGEPILVDDNGDRVFWDEITNNWLLLSPPNTPAVLPLGEDPYEVNDFDSGVDDLGFTFFTPPPDPADGATAEEFEFLFDISKVTAQNFRLSEEVMESEYNIAASTIEIIKTGPSEHLQRGNNENMNALYALFLVKDFAVGDVHIGSFDSFATSIRFDVANTLNFAKRTSDNSRILTLAAENHRTSVSGVSLDEEMTNLVKFQHAYSGAARVITAMDEVLDRLINGTGRVGL